MSLKVDIRKAYPRFQLDVAFETENEIFGLLGASGCGKSVTLKCIAGIETPDEGQIILGDQVLFDSEKKVNLSPQKRRVGYLFQQYALFPNMTVYQNIAVAVRDADKAEKHDIVMEKIRAFQLEGLEKKRPYQLSGGQQQRTALARILVNRPRALLLDEPLTALDSYLKWQVELELADTLREFGGTTVFVSHSREEIYRLCDSVSVVDRGKSGPYQPVGELFNRPTTLSACLLSGCKNFSRIHMLDGNRAGAEDWGVELELPPDGPENPTWVGIRAHHVILSRTPAGPNAMSCRVDRVIDDLFSTIVMCATPGGRKGYSLIRVELDKAAWAALEGEEELYLTLPPESIMTLTES